MQDGKNVILCIDDDPDILEYLDAVLTAAGYVVATAPSAEEGLKVYKEVSPELMIVDLMMEEIDAGTTFVKELRIIGNTAPIFMLSSMGDNLAETTDCSALGLSGVFQKPVDKEKMLTAIAAKL